jgi:Nucleoside 2-deoxyribosyltransferase like
VKKSGHPAAPSTVDIMAAIQGKCTILKPPVKSNINGPSVFLSGSVEMGAAVDWQSEFTSRLSHLNITIINPRRDEWDRTWKQDISNPQFKQQVTWELEYLEQADLVAVYFGPGTTSPVSMLEFGLHARAGKVVVCCPDGFLRRGNVQVVCESFELPLVETLEEFAELIAERLTRNRNLETS